MNIPFPNNLLTNHLTIKRLKTEDLPILANNLFMDGGFYETQRGLSSPQKIIDYYTNFLNDPSRLCLVAHISDQPQNFVATSSYCEPSTPMYKLEIGFTWIAPKWQKTYVNRELKLAMLTYAFEDLKVKRVQFSAQTLNHNSINAIKKLGATYEGVLRNWRYNSIQDTGERAIFSIIDSEWEKIKSEILLKS